MSKSFKRNILTMLSGSIISQIIIVLSSPILTRLFSTEEIGIFTVFLTVASLFIPIANFRYDLVLVKEKEKKALYELIRVCFTISYILISAIIIFIFIYSFNNSDFFGINIYFFYLLVPVIYFSSINNIFNSLSNKAKFYNVMSKVLIYKALGLTLMQIIMGIFKLGELSLIITYVLSLMFGYFIMRKKLSTEYQISFTYSFNKEIIVKYIDQLRYSTPSILLNSLSFSLIIFIISILYSSHEVGLYSMTTRILGLPITVISLAFSKVFYERANESFHKYGEFRTIYLKSTLLLVGISLPIFVVLSFTSPIIFEVFLGENWREAGEYVAYLAPYYAIRLVVSCLSLSIIVINKQKFELILQSLFIISASLSYVLSDLYNLNIKSFFIIITITYSFSYIIFYLYILKYSKKEVI